MSQKQRIMSFDVGIKNLAYCIFEIGETGNSIPFKMIDWNVLNLIEKEEPHVFCNCPAIKEKTTKKSKKVVVLENLFIDSSLNIPTKRLCGKVAKFKKGETFFCEKHSKTQIDHIIPIKSISISQLKKQKIEELIKISDKYSILDKNGEIPKKKAILEKMEAFFKNKCLESVIESKKVRAGDTDLIAIGKNMKLLLNLVNEIELVTHVIIENQISPIANRMKTVQGMLAQFFIMKNTDIVIDFVSSSNKLKGFIKEEKENPEKSEKIEEKENPEKTNAQKYKDHKKDGIFYTNRILEKNTWLSSWIPNLNESKKKDDLADSFLQGIWFLKNNQKIKLLENSLEIQKIIP
jgi:hypothetical protein